MILAFRRRGLFEISRRSTLAVLLACVVALASPAAAQTSGVESCALGDLTLESGAVIPNFRMTYITHGTLNQDRSNAILSLHGLRGNRDSQSFLAGPGKALDTGRYFVIQPDTLGVASVEPNATTSPSRSGLNMKFPRFSIRDMVKAEYRMLTECLKIRHLTGVIGISMGGMETIQWSVSYPDFMDLAMPILTQARAGRQTTFIWEAARQAIMLDPKWRDGNYPANDPPRRGAGIGINIQNAFGVSAAGFQQTYADNAAVARAFDSSARQLAFETDARDWIYRTWAIEEHDIAATLPFNGDLAAAARSIKAQLLVVTNCRDQLLSPDQGGILDVASHAARARVVNLDDIAGHGAFADTRSIAVITSEVQAALRRATGRQGEAVDPNYFKRMSTCR